jgi:hypothetical protein
LKGLSAVNLTERSGLGSTSSIDIFPHICGSADGSRLTAIWEHTDTLNRSHTIVASSSNDGGLTWSRAATLSAPSLSSMVVNGVVGSPTLSRIVAFWDASSGEALSNYDGETDDDIEKYYAKMSFCASSNDGGATWSAATKLPSADSLSEKVFVATRPDGSLRLTTVWNRPAGDEKWAIVSSSSQDGGATWSAPVHIADSGPKIEPRYLLGPADGAHLILGWFTEPDVDAKTLRTSSSNDGGLTWSAPSDGAFPRSRAGGRTAFSMSADGTRLVTAWFQYMGHNPTWHGASEAPLAVLSSWSSDGGVNWSTPACLSSPSEHGPIPRIAISANSTHLTVVWYVRNISRRGSPPNEKYLDFIQAASSSDGGVTWTEPRELSERGQSTKGRPWPQVAASADGTRLTAIWDGEIRDRRRIIQTTSSSDGGVNWSEPTDLSLTRKEAFRPQLAVSADGGHVTAIWFQPFGSRNSTIEVVSFKPTS